MSFCMQPYYEVVMHWSGGRDLDLMYRTSAHGPNIGHSGGGNAVHSGDVGRACGGTDAEERLTWGKPGTRDDVVIVGAQAAGTDVKCPIDITVKLYVYGVERGTGYQVHTSGDQKFSLNVEPPQNW